MCSRKLDGNSPIARWISQPGDLVYGIALFEWNIREGVIWFSDEWSNMIQEPYDGTVPNESVWWLERLHPEDIPSLQKAILAVHAGFVDRYEAAFRFRRKDGTWLRFLNRSRVTHKDANGAPLIATGICINITDLLSDAGSFPDGLRSPGMDIHTILENSPDLFIRFARDLVPVYVNPAITKYLGGSSIPLEDGEISRSRIVDDYKAEFRKHVERVFSERTSVREEMQLRLRDGGEIIGDCTYWPEYNEAGELQYAMVQFRDITEQRRIEQRNMLNERRLEALNKLTSMENVTEEEVLKFVLSTVLSITSSRSGFIFIYNEQGSDKGLLVWSPDHYELIEPKYLSDSSLPDDILVQVRERGMRSINNGDGETPLYVVFGGKMSVIRGIIAPVIEDEHNVCIAGVCNKASDYDEFDMLQFETFLNSAWLAIRRRRFIAELQIAKEAAEAANKAKDAFLANVSHELRTPLNGVLSMLQLIDSLKLETQQREYLQVASSSGKTLLRIISDLLDFSCMESGKMSLADDLFNFKSAVISACNVFRKELAGKEIDFRCEIETSTSDLLVGDEGRLRQIIFNIVGNAVKYTPSGRISVNCFPYAGEAPAGKTGVVLKVQDTGIGIPEDKLSGIFDAFIQVESSYRRKYSGTGLGLSIVKHLVTLMGGKVSVESEEGVGTTVSCLLFFDIPEPGQYSASHPLRRGESPPVTDLEILVAEDDDVGTIAIKAFLTKRGHKVVCVKDGLEALEALQLRDFHCLFTDITMPNIDGLELATRIREGRFLDCPPGEATLTKVREVFPETSGELHTIDSGMIVAAVSAHSMIGDRERFLAQGMDLYVSKPLVRKELDSALEQVKRRVDAGK